MKHLALFLCCVFTFCLPHARADESTPLLYSRDTVLIHRAALPASELMPWQKPHEAIIPLLTFDVEVRDANTLYNQNGWYNLSSPSENKGVLLVFPAPTVAPIAASAQYAPLDVLMIDKEGTIREIAPKLMMSELSEELYPSSPVLAFLFLRGGLCEKLAINPGDQLQYKIFKKPPPVLSVPANEPPAQAAH